MDRGLGDLCTLTLVAHQKNGAGGRAAILVPIGRLYNGHDGELASGPYKRLSYDCPAGDGGCCTVDMPSVNDRAYFWLTTFAKPTLVDKVARFLVWLMFGARSASLGNLC